MDLAAAVDALGKGLERREPAPGVFAFFERRAMHRVRSYVTASLGPISDRGTPHEFVLLGHLHSGDGGVVLVEGFNGQEGARWAARAADLLRREGLLAPAARILGESALRSCALAMK